ncbi:hypothetical protein [Acaryochloris sp. IP29b_bin.148]|uniref:hypothetical protein n=1 Tax=Acaryochloris sp. IP29b_bin.148 TaxID=2969218 RepID=UPI00261FD354|nr:hypothetical protein [Acaryochloris sp. IP29b_bin.148]
MTPKVPLIQQCQRALLCTVVAGSCLLAQPAAAQRVDPIMAADAVYSQLPELPKENQHIRKKGNKPVPNSTLISRLIQYHTLVKGRSPQYRFDWKITLADYLGLYENLREEEYPGQSYLKTNPMERDRKLIRQLTRQQRLALTQMLSNIYVSQAPPPQAAPSPEQAQPKPKEPAAAEPEPITRPKLVPLPGSGSADLLKVPASQSTPQPAPSPSTTPQSTTPVRKPGEAQKLSF